MSLFWVMFWKGVVLAVWSEFQDWREDRSARATIDGGLLIADQNRSSSGRPEKPLALPDLVTNRLD